MEFEPLSLSKPWFALFNTGADYGRVLVGLQVPADNKEHFDKFIMGLGNAGVVQIINETDNPVYKHFLQ
jgi:threonine dehydratase